MAGRITARQLMTNLVDRWRDFTASTDLTGGVPTHYPPGFAEKGEGELLRWSVMWREERRELCGQLIQARAAIMIVTSEFPWRRAARESHSPTVSPMWPQTPHTPNWYLSAEISSQSGHNLSDWLLDLPRRTSPVSHLALPILYHLSQGSLVRTLPHRALTGRRPGYSSPTCPSSGMFLHLKSFFSLESISLEPEHLSKRGSVFVFSFQTVILHFLSSFEAPHASLASFTIYHQNTTDLGWFFLGNYGKSNRFRTKLVWPLHDGGGPSRGVCSRCGRADDTLCT